MRHIIGDIVGGICLVILIYGGLWAAAILEEIWR